MEKGTFCSHCPADLFEADALDRLSHQHLSPDGLPSLYPRVKQDEVVLVVFDHFLSDHLYLLLCFFNIVKLTVSSGSLWTLRKKNGDL